MFGAWLHLTAMALILVGSLVMAGIGVASTRSMVARIMYGIIIIAALSISLHRDTYLPFLGSTVMPCSILEERVPEHADTEVSLNGITPGAKVLYWATEPATNGLATIADWRRAYLDFANAGVAVADAGGHVVLRIRKPQPYTVPTGRRLEAHVHWRVCGSDGMLGPIQATEITGGPIGLP
jgi:hypothetical protein